MSNNEDEFIETASEVNDEQLNSGNKKDETGKHNSAEYVSIDGTTWRAEPEQSRSRTLQHNI